MGIFYVCYYHIIWATKYRMPVITPAIEKVIIEAIHLKSQQLKCPIHAVNTVEDHIHVAATIPPSQSIWEWARDVKGLAAYTVNHEFPNLEEIFKWQRGYSVLTFGEKTLPFVVKYIEKQNEHHQSGTIEPYLEYLED